MKLNKNSSFVLIHLLSGAQSANAINTKLPKTTLRSTQRALVRLTELQLIKRHGVNNPKYSLRYENIIKQPINTNLLEDINRPNCLLNQLLIQP